MPCVALGCVHLPSRPKKDAENCDFRIFEEPNNQAPLFRRIATSHHFQKLQVCSKKKTEDSKTVDFLYYIYFYIPYTRERRYNIYIYLWNRTVLLSSVFFLINQIAKNTHPYISIGVGETIRTAAFGLTMDFHHYAVPASCPALPWHLLYAALGLPVLYVRLRDSPFYRRLLPFC